MPETISGVTLQSSAAVASDLVPSVPPLLRMTEQYPALGRYLRGSKSLHAVLCIPINETEIDLGSRSAVLRVSLLPFFQGHESQAQGGMVITLLDTVSACLAACFCTEEDSMAVTGTLKCKYLGNVPLCQELVIRCKAGEVRQGCDLFPANVPIEAWITKQGCDKRLVEANGIFFFRPVERFDYMS